MSDVTRREELSKLERIANDARENAYLEETNQGVFGKVKSILEIVNAPMGTWFPSEISETRYKRYRKPLKDIFYMVQHKGIIVFSAKDSLFEKFDLFIYKRGGWQRDLYTDLEALRRIEEEANEVKRKYQIEQIDKLCRAYGMYRKRVEDDFDEREKELSEIIRRFSPIDDWCGDSGPMEEE